MALSTEERLKILEVTKELLVGLLPPHDVWGGVDDVRAISDFNVKFKMLYHQVHTIVEQHYLKMADGETSRTDEQAEWITAAELDLTTQVDVGDAASASPNHTHDNDGDDQTLDLRDPDMV